MIEDKTPWAVTYYLLLLYAGIIYFVSEKSCMIDGFLYWLLFSSALAILIVGSFLLIDMHRSNVKYRKRIQDILEHLSPEFERFEKPIDTSWGKDLPYTLPFILLLTVFAVFTVWLLAKRYKEWGTEPLSFAIGVLCVLTIWCVIHITKRLCEREK